MMWIEKTFTKQKADGQKVMMKTVDNRVSAVRELIHPRQCFK
jgi:hypothetical protein